MSSTIISRILPRGSNQFPESTAMLRLHACLPLCAIALAWTAQVLFWRLAGWQLSLRLNLFWMGMPLCAFAIASLVATLGAGIGKKSRLRLLPVWSIGATWIALTVFFTVLGILYKNLLFLCIAAISLGLGLSPLLQLARKRYAQYDSRTGVFIASVGGVAVGLGITEGALFVNQHALLLIIGLAACLGVALYCLRGVGGYHGARLHAAPASMIKQSVPNSIVQAGCGILMAGPIALAPSVESLCGLGVAGFGFGLFIHHGVMMLPSLIAYEFRQTIIRYALTALYFAGLVAGHAIPLWYLAQVSW